VDKTTFRHLRYALDLSLTETAKILGVAEASVTAWQSGRYRIPAWVAERLRELRDVQAASHADRDIRRALEDRYEHLDSRLYLGEVPDGWLPIVERFLVDLDAHLPEHLKNGDSFSLGLKEKWGSLRLDPFLDAGDDVESGEKFWNWIDDRIRAAEEESERTCARCGTTDDVDFTKSGWRLPLCRRHRLLREGEI
jgi:transcriptional regulator with XRE-family HTH domain